MFPHGLYQALFSYTPRDLRMNSSLTNAVLAFHFISRGTDAPEWSLQILTGPRRTRTRKCDTLISIFREKEDKQKMWPRQETNRCRFIGLLNDSNTDSPWALWSAGSWWTKMPWTPLILWMLLIRKTANSCDLFLRVLSLRRSLKHCPQ